MEGYLTPEKFDRLAQLSWETVKTVMEIGFNAGHSAEFFLNRNTHLKVVSFEIGRHEYSKLAKHNIDTKYPGRHEIVWGDSVKTVPKFRNQKFDVILIDGGHEFDTVRSDLVNCMRLATPKTIVIVDDVVYRHDWMEKFTWAPTRVWSQFKTIGLVVETDHIEHANGSGMSIGHYTGVGDHFSQQVHV